MLLKAKKIYRKLPLGVKLKIRKYVLRRNNSIIKIKGKTIEKINLERINYTDDQLFNNINKFSVQYEDKVKKNSKFNLLGAYSIYRDLPIEKDTILFETFHGKSMTDNPFALFLEIVKRDEMKGNKFVWVLNHDASVDIQASRFKKMTNLFFVKLGSEEYVKYLATAGYLINNTSFPPYFVRRKEQRYLNTWHGTPLKTLGKDMKGSIGQHKNLSRNFLQTTHILSPNSFTGNVILKSHDLDGIYDGKMIEEGYPRVDLITSTNSELYRKEILGKAIKLEKGKKIALYAPTWRGEVGNVGDITKELEGKYKLISENISDDYQLLLKVHPLLFKYIKNSSKLSKSIIPDELDSCEIMSNVELLITDYSSIFIDFLVRNKPIILYQYDQEEYLDGRGMYFDLNNLSFPLARTDEEMKHLLQNIDTLPKYYREKDKFTYTQNGTTSQKVIDNFFYESENMLIKNSDNNKDNILVYCSNPEEYKVEFINSLVNEKANVLLWFSGKINDLSENFFRSLNKEIKIFFEWDSMLFTPYEWCEYQYLIHSNNEHYELEKDYKRIFKREIQRNFSQMKFSKGYYLGDLNSKHYLLLMLKGMEDSSLYIPYNSVEAILAYHKVEFSNPKSADFLMRYEKVTGIENTPISKVEENQKIKKNNISYDVITISESKAYLIPSDILSRNNIILIFRNNVGSQLEAFISEFITELYDEQKNYIVYANPQIASQLEEFSNIFFVPNNIDRSLFLNLLGKEELIVNFSNSANDDKLPLLIKNKNRESYLFNYDPSDLLTFFQQNDGIISLETMVSYSMKIKIFLLDKELRALKGDNIGF